MSRLLLPGLCAMALLSPLVMADANVKYECRNGDLVRHVELVYEDQDSKLPCSVQYTKDSEEPGQTKTLWSAQNEANYCEEKLDAFIEKLQGMGWTCQQVKEEAQKAGNP